MSVDPAVNTAAGAPLAHIFAGRRDGERSVQSREPVRGNSPAVGEGAVGGVAYGEHSFWSAISRRNGGGREVFECDLSTYGFVAHMHEIGSKTELLKGPSDGSLYSLYSLIL